MPVGGFLEICAPTGIRTPVVALKGLRPSPLDDGGNHSQERADFIIALPSGQAFLLICLLWRVDQAGRGDRLFRG